MTQSFGIGNLLEHFTTRFTSFTCHSAVCVSHPLNTGSTKMSNPESGIRNPETELQKRKRNTESNVNDRKFKNFTLHNLVQPKENLF